MLLEPQDLVMRPSGPRRGPEVHPVVSTHATLPAHPQLEFTSMHLEFGGAQSASVLQMGDSGLQMPDRQQTQGPPSPCGGEQKQPLSQNAGPAQSKGGQSHP